MGKFKCICGEVLSDTCSRDGFEGKLFSSQDYDNYDFSKGRDVDQCDKCGTLMIEEPIGSANFIYYKPQKYKEHIWLFKDYCD